MSMSSAPLHWERTQPGTRAQWQTVEQRDGVPDFLILRQGVAFCVKMRTSATWRTFDTLADAKVWAESI